MATIAAQPKPPTAANKADVPVPVPPDTDSARLACASWLSRLSLPDVDDEDGAAVAAVAGAAVAAGGSGRSVVFLGSGVEISPTSGPSIDADMDAEPPAAEEESVGSPTSSEPEPELLSSAAEAEAEAFFSLLVGFVVEGVLVTSATSADEEDEEDDLRTNTESSLSDSSPADVLFLLLELDLLESASVSAALVLALESDDCVAVRETRFEMIDFAFSSSFCDEFCDELCLVVVVVVLALVGAFVAGAVAVVVEPVLVGAVVAGAVVDGILPFTNVVLPTVWVTASVVGVAFDGAVLVAVVSVFGTE